MPNLSTLPDPRKSGRKKQLATPARAGDHLGRFVLRKPLGKGGQAEVWLGFDPRLEREVAVKLLLQTGAADSEELAHWLREARSVSRLHHPNIVQVFEADVHEGQPYLVFEYVAGQTLAETLRGRGALAPQEALPLIIDVLDGLGAAHAAGIVHRDLKPSNIMVDTAGRARVMDFGIAARSQGSGQIDAAAGAWGTPGYISPEAASGHGPSASMDLFSATLVLTEMLCGHRLVEDSDPWRAIQRVTLYDLALPTDLHASVDDALRAILMRGLARDPAQRQASAQELADELRRWLRPVTVPLAAGEDASNGTLEFLLRRMRHKSDFPAMSGTIVRIQSVSSSDRESVASLTNEILKDVALTNKLLRLVNTPQYTRGGPISTVSRAVSLVGFNGVRNMALSLVLLEHMQDKAHASKLKEEFLRSLMAGAIASELSPVRNEESEEAFLGAMFQNLGRLLTEYYFPEEARAIRALMEGKDAVPEAHAATMVLGISYEQLGDGISRAWNLPDMIRHGMRKPIGTPPAQLSRDPAERMRWLALAANDLADALLQTEPKDALAAALRAGQRYQRCLGADGRAVEQAVQQARERLAELALAIDFKVPTGSAAARLLAGPVVPPGAEDASGRSGLAGASGAVGGVPSLPGMDLLPTQPFGADAPHAPAQGRRSSEMLAAGIQDITQAMTDDFKLADVIRMILETMFRAMAFRHIVFCMKDPRQSALVARFGLGAGVERVVKCFRVPLQSPKPDLLELICARGADTLIANAAEPRVVSRLPKWYLDEVHAPTFLLLPLVLKGTPVGLIYADCEGRAEMVLSDEELALLRTLRNQAVMAFRQAS